MLCDELGGSMITIAKDVKLQIEFNPLHVEAYRLIGYETRKLEDRDFHNDRKDAGDIGAGHSVTAFYEIVPVGGKIPDTDAVDESRYAPKKADETAAKVGTDAKTDAKSEPLNDSPAWMFVNLRWKQPDASESTLKTFPVEFHPEKEGVEMHPSLNFQYASGVALGAMLLRESAYTGTADFNTVLELIQPAVGDDEQRVELRNIIQKIQEILVFCTN